MEYKRQKLDPIQFILNLNLDEFHAEWLRSSSKIRNTHYASYEDLQLQMYNKLLDLQDLVFTDKPLPRSPQVFDDLEIKAAPERAEVVAKKDGSKDCWTVGTRLVYADDDFDILQGAQIRHFLLQGHSFHNVKVGTTNSQALKVFEQLVKHDAIANLTVWDEKLLLSESFQEKPLRLERLDLFCNLTEDHAEVVKSFLTNNDNRLETLGLDPLWLDKDEVRTKIFDGIRDSRFLRHLCIDSHSDDWDYQYDDDWGLPQVIRENQSLTRVTGLGWDDSYIDTLRAAMDRNLDLTLENFYFLVKTEDTQLLLDMLTYQNHLNSTAQIDMQDDDFFQSFFGYDRNPLARFIEGIKTTKCDIYLDLSPPPEKSYHDCQNLILQALCEPNSVSRLYIRPPRDEHTRTFLENLLLSKLSELKVRRLDQFVPLVTKKGFMEAFSGNHELTQYGSYGERALLDGADLGDVESMLPYILLLNRGGRRILKHGPISIGLWPLVLERSKRVKLDGPWASDSKEDMATDII